MPPTDPDDEDWYDDEDESADLDDLDSVPCPECGAAIYADLDHCPKCGYWLIDDDHRTRGPGLIQSRGVRIVAAVLLVIFVLALLAGTLGM
jgi:ribosomal protein S27AE